MMENVLCKIDDGKCIMENVIKSEDRSWKKIGTRITQMPLAYADLSGFSFKTFNDLIPSPSPERRRVSAS